MSLDAGRVGVRADQVDIHGRVTSPSFLNELLDDLPEWTDMPVWVNGAEELLPSDNSVPVTSPILADIAYPDIRRDNQYFTYRESPTPVDGLAKIKSIKGNTLKWNQLCNGIATSTADGITTEYDSSTHKYKITNDSRATNYSSGSTRGVFTGLQNTENNHKYLLHMTPQIDGVSFFCVTDGSTGNLFNGNSVIWQSSGQSVQLRITNEYDFVNVHPIGDVTEFNALVIDLTRMFGAGKEPSTVDEFVSLFGNLFYAYNTGTLLSFNGTGLKTTGKNLIDPSSKTTYDGENGLRWYQTQGLKLKANNTYTFSASNTGEASVTVYIIDPVTRTPFASGSLVTTYTPTYDVIVYFQAYRSSGIPSGTEFQLEVGSQTEYEPYISHTTNLPIATYFPTGMKSAGSVYDELTPTKSITRIGADNLGSLTWNLYGANNHEFTADLPNMKVGTLNAITTLDITVVGNYAQWVAQRPNNSMYKDSNGKLHLRLNPYTTVAELTNALQNVYLYYELATPVELPTLSLGE